MQQPDYQRLHDLAERLEIIQIVRDAIASADRNEGRPMDDVFDQLDNELQVSKEMAASPKAKTLG